MLDTSDDCIIVDTEGDQQSTDKRLLFTIQVADQEVFGRAKDTVIAALKDSLRCVDVHQAVVEESEGRVLFYEKVSKEPADLFEESITGSSVQVGSVSYDAIASKLLDVVVEGETGNVEGMGKSSCFNCDGDHNLKDCPLPRNAKKISRSRNAMNSKSTSRYHLTVDNKYAKFKPGRLSDDLKKALGLSRRSLPLHIYRMRVCGYPIAWLKEAEVSKSGLEMIHTEQCAEQKGSNANAVVYDLDKIVEYPGFNIRCGDDFVDVRFVLFKLSLSYLFLIFIFPGSVQIQPAPDAGKPLQGALHPDAEPKRRVHPGPTRRREEQSGNYKSHRSPRRRSRR